MTSLSQEQIEQLLKQDATPKLVKTFKPRASVKPNITPRLRAVLSQKFPQGGYVERIDVSKGILHCEYDECGLPSWLLLEGKPICTSHAIFVLNEMLMQQGS